MTIGDRSPIVGEHPMFGAIDGHGAAVREDPLGSGMAEWDSDADDSLRVVTAHDLDDDITLFGAQSCSVREAVQVVVDLRSELGVSCDTEDAEGSRGVSGGPAQGCDVGATMETQCPVEDR